MDVVHPVVLTPMLMSLEDSQNTWMAFKEASDLGCISDIMISFILIEQLMRTDDDREIRAGKVFFQPL